MPQGHTARRGRLYRSSQGALASTTPIVTAVITVTSIAIWITR
jgi:hypothetical protein